MSFPSRFPAEVTYAIIHPTLQRKNLMDENRSKALAAALSQIEKQFGKGSIMRLGANEVARDIQVISTGSLGLDIALGVGGLPRGRVIEIYGPESSGKTTLTLQVIAQMQKMGVLLHSSMRSTRSIPSMRKKSVSTYRNY